MAAEKNASSSSLTFEQGLRHFFRGIEDGNPFLLLALADAGGFADQKVDWLQQTASGRLLSLGPHGERSVSELLSVWARLQSGTSDEVFEAIIGFLLDHSQSIFLLRDLVKPLALVGRVDMVPQLARRAYAAGFREDFTAEAIILELGKAGAWEEVRGMCAVEQEFTGSPAISTSAEALLWKYVYHQRQTETVLPRLAELPYDPRQAYSEVRKWVALAFRIRAEGPDLRVPVIARDRQPHGYQRAAAMQVAALEDDSSAASYVRDLRGVLQDRTVTMQFVDQGLTVEATTERRDYLAERIMIAARRRQYGKVAELARIPAQGMLIPPADLAVEAFLEEGDWRGASQIAETHDLRRRPVPRGLDDTRKEDYLALQKALAGAAARAGDDEDAQRFLANYRHAVVSMPNRDGRKRVGSPTSDTTDIFKRVDLWPATLMVGVAEGRLPRPTISMFLHVFTRFY
jgi:hypothetical protein